MIDTPITKKFFQKLDLYLELKRQDKRTKKSDRGKMIWKMEKYILLWTVRGHWHLGSPLNPEYIGDRLREGGFSNEEMRFTRQVMQNLMARGFAYHPKDEGDKDTIQMKDKGFLMGEVLEISDSWWECGYIIFIFFVWLVVGLVFLKVMSEILDIFKNILSNRFILFGLIFNTAGALLLLFPLLNIKKNIDDDYIVEMNKKTGDYTQKKHLRDRKFGLWGFVLIALGFLFQIMGIL